MALNEIMTIAEVADYLRTTEPKVREWVDNSEIPCFQLDSELRFKRSHIAAWLEERASSKAAPVQRPPVSVSTVLDKNCVCFLKHETKTEVLEELIDLLAGTSHVMDREDLARGIFRREELMSTGIGMGVAVPHVRLSSVKGLVMAMGIAREPIMDYPSLDDEPIQVVFMIAATEKQHEDYLGLLSFISSLWKDREVRHALLHCQSVEEAYEFLIEKGNA